MRTLVPPLIADHAAADDHEGSFEGAVLLVDATGSTALVSSLRFAGTDGDEVLAEIMWAVFAPQVDAVIAEDGFVGAFAGDGFVALFPGAPAESVPRARRAALRIRHHMEEHAEQHHRFGTSRFEVKSVLSHGLVEWRIWEPAQGQHAFMFTGSAITEAQVAETPEASGTVVVVPSAASALDAEHLENGDGSVTLRTDVPALARIESLPSTTRSAAPFFPQWLAEQASLGEFRSVVTVFVKLADMPESGPASSDMNQLLELAAQRGAFVCDINRPDPTDVGPTVLLYWGAPTSFESNIERAVTFLLDAREQLGPDRMRAAASLDTLFAGFIGSDAQSAYTCIGVGVNLAARMVSRASWGDLWIDEELTSVLAPEVQRREVGTRSFKGFERPIAVSELVAKGDVELPSQYPGRLIGRDDAVHEIKTWIETSLDKRSSVLVVQGEAGTGKSRTMWEIQQSFGDDVSWMVGHTDPISRAPMNPIAYMVRRGMDVQLGDSPSVMRAKVTERLTAMGERSDDTLRSELELAAEPVLALIGALDSESSFFDLSPSLRFERTIDAIVAILAFDANNRGVVAQLEDVQWLDASTTEVLDRIMSRLEDMRIAVVVTSRDPVEAKWVESTVLLGRLDTDEITEQAEAITGERVSPSLAAILHDRTDGNPYYVEQILAFMQDSDLLVRRDDGLRARFAGTRVPDTVQAVLTARIDRLPERVRDAVHHAAVLGREFDLQVLLRMASATAADVDVATEAGIWVPISELRYLFRQSLMRDAAYEMQLHRTLVELHTKAAEAIEFLSAGDTARQASSLAHHLERADQPLAAARRYREAGAYAVSRHAHSDATTRFRRAVELGGDMEPQEYFELLADLEGVYRLVGDADGHDRLVDELEARAVDLSPAAQLVAGRARVLYLNYLGDFGESLVTGERLLALADSQTSSSDKVQTRIPIAYAARAVGDHDRADRLAIEAFELASATDDARMIGATHDLRGGVAYDRGDYVTAASLHRAAVDTLAAVGDQVGELRALNNLGTALWGIGDFSQAADVHATGVERSRAIGHRLVEGDNLDNLGGARWAVGDFTAALEYYEDSLAIRRRINDVWGIGISLSNLGVTFESLGDLDRSVAAFTDGIVNDERIGRAHGAAYSYHGLGWAQLRLGNHRQAGRAFERALELREELGEPVLALESRAGMAAVHSAAGETAEATEIAAEVAAELDDAFQLIANEPFRVYRVCADLLAEKDPFRARELENIALRRLEEQSLHISDPNDRESYLGRIRDAYGFAS